VTLDQVVRIPVGGVDVDAAVNVPPRATGVVVFAHGSGSSRHSPRNQYVARVLQAAGLGTVLADLLTVAEEQYDRQSGELRFDIPFLAARVIGILDWLTDNWPTGNWPTGNWLTDTWLTGNPLPIGLFGASTGAAAALVAAASRRERVQAVVSRGGRPDLAGDALSEVEAPTLLIVGGRDRQVLELNRSALERLPATAELEIVPGATHLFEEPGTLEQVAVLARDWFRRHVKAV
jgi:putative phosphoribosyl transferase